MDETECRELCEVLNRFCSEGESRNGNDLIFFFLLTLTEHCSCLSHILQMQLMSFLFISQELMVMDNII